MQLPLEDIVDSNGIIGIRGNKMTSPLNFFEYIYSDSCETHMYNYIILVNSKYVKEWRWTIFHCHTSNNTERFLRLETIKIQLYLQPHTALTTNTVLPCFYFSYISQLNVILRRRNSTVHFHTATLGNALFFFMHACMNDIFPIFSDGNYTEQYFTAWKKKLLTWHLTGELHSQ